MPKIFLYALSISKKYMIAFPTLSRVLQKNGIDDQLLHDIKSACVKVGKFKKLFVKLLVILSALLLMLLMYYVI